MEHHDKTILIIWKCPNCGRTYQDIEGYNENPICGSCGAVCQHDGESYPV